MRSKVYRHWLSLGLIVVGAFTSTSCSYFFGEKEDKKNSYNLTVDEKTGVSCVKKNNDLIRDYFDLKRDDIQIAQELRDMKECIRDTVELFVKHTRTSGNDPNTYTAHDIHEFLSSVFDTYDLAPQFMVDAFRLKDSLMGGSDVKVSKDEVRLLPDYVDYVYEGLATLSAERHLLFKTDFETPDHKFVHPNDWEKFAPAAAKFMQVVAGFNKLKLKRSGDFDYANMVRVIMYFMDDQEDIDHWSKSFSLINSLQALVASGQRDTIEIKKLNFTVQQLATLYLAYVEYYRYLKDDFFYQDMATVFTFPALVSRSVEKPEAFAGQNPLILNSIHVKILQALGRSADAAPQSLLSMDYIDDIVLTLKLNDSLPDYINPETLKAMFPQLFNLWFSPKPCQGQGCFGRFVTSSQVNLLQQLLDQWTERQMWINKIMPTVSSKLTRSSSEIRKRSQNPNISSIQAAIQKVNHTRWADKYLILGPIENSKELTFKDMVIFHDIYTLAQLFVRPFNGNDNKPQLLDYYLDRDQALTFYKWFRPLGLELKLVDPRSSADSTAAFTEINMFGSTATDPEKMDLSELIEYFEISISTSFRAVDIMEDEFSICRTTKIYDVFGYEKLDGPCFRRVWFGRHNDLLFQSLPRLQRALKSVSDTEYKELLSNLEKAARQGLIVNEPVETDTFRQLSSILQYSESLFERFDTNQDDVILPAEMKLALAHIVPNIKGVLVSSVDPKTVDLLHKGFPNFEEDLITYIIAKQELPGLLTSETMGGAAISLADLKLFKSWTDSKNQWLEQDARVTRQDVLLVVSGLSALARVTKIKNLKAHFYKHELEFQKPLMGPQDPLLVPLAKELACSYTVEKDLLQWLFDNHKKYWNDVLDWVEPGKFVLFGWDLSTIGASWNDIPEINDIEISAPIIGDVNLKGTTHGWEGNVTYKLIELVKNDPKLGPLCGVPFVPGVHRISAMQRYKQNMCTVRSVFPLMPAYRDCKDYFHKPY